MQDEGAWIRHNIRYYSELHGVNTYNALAVAYCESRFKNVPSVNYPKEDSFGPFQEQSEFWKENATLRGMISDPKLRKSIEANIEMAMWRVSNYGWGRWTCKPGSKDVLLQKKELDRILAEDSSTLFNRTE